MNVTSDTLAPELAGVVDCRLCPRLVAWREEVARVKRAAYRAERYWGRPVPGFGDPAARVVLVGLAPGAHGGNRTGRIFTGDASAAFLFHALHAAGFASQPTSVARDDGLVLRDAFVTAAVRCVPPANRPTPEEIGTCGTRWLDLELPILARHRVVVALGRIAFDAYLAHLRRRRVLPARGPRPAFAHGARWLTPEGRTLLGSYHPSFQNTNTGRLTQRMLQGVLRTARRLADRGS